MKKYGVSIPIAGYIYKEVEANSKEEAKEKAMSESFEDDEIMELDTYDKLVEGNVCYTYHTSVSVDYLGDCDEDDE